MPAAQPLPKKFLSSLDEIQEQLRLLGQRARVALNELECSRGPYRQMPFVLRDIEATAYRLALELSEMDVAGSCDKCPAAPPRTLAQLHLLVLAEELERQAVLARRKAQSME